MKKILFILVLFFSLNSFSQSLRDSLFSGKLKADSALVAKSKLPPKDSAKKTETVDSLKKATGVVGVGADAVAVQTNTGNAPRTEIKYSDNPRIWKKFTDEYTKIINAEMSNTRKIKKGGYTVTLEYEIGTDGVVTTKNIICDPKSEGLIDLINEKMMPNAPQLAPQIVNGAPKKSSKRQILIFTKEKN